MGRDDRRDGRIIKVAPPIPVLSSDGEGVEDTLDRVRRLASDTAELLIVNEERLNDARERPSSTEQRLDALRQRVDTGDYAVLPLAVAEAMVRSADDLEDE